MMKLCQLVDVVVNNEACVVLKVKEGKEMDLIALGCFDGNETMLRLTKGKVHTATIFGGKEPFSWHWGSGGYTIVSEKTKQCGQLIQGCIEEDFGIYIGADPKNIKKTLHIRTLEDKKTIQHHLKILFFPDRDREKCNIHQDGEHFKWFDNVRKARDYVLDHYTIEKKWTEVAPTGCAVENYSVSRK